MDGNGLALAFALCVGAVQVEAAQIEAGRAEAAQIEAVQDPTRVVDFRGQEASREARALARWIGLSGDAAGRAIAIVDKKQARLHVFDANHRLVASTPVLLGQTLGDHTVAGVGERAQLGRVGLHERTTPAGRFETQPGRNLQGEHVIWLDYDAAFAIHRVRPGRGMTQRLAQLASPTPEDNRVSLGCVVVPVAFYGSIVQPTFAQDRGVVYVLPDEGVAGQGDAPWLLRTGL